MPQDHVPICINIFVYLYSYRNNAHENYEWFLGRVYRRPQKILSGIMSEIVLEHISESVSEIMPESLAEMMTEVMSAVMTEIMK